MTSNNRLQNWHESFNLLDDNEEEEELSSDEEMGNRSRTHNALNRSFVDFLFDDAANTRSPHASVTSLHNSFDDVMPETLSDSFIARSYPSASVLRSSSTKPTATRPHSPSKSNKKKHPKSKETAPSDNSSGVPATAEEGDSSSSLDLLLATPEASTPPSPPVAAAQSTDPPSKEETPCNDGITSRGTIPQSQDLHQSMDLSQVFMMKTPPASPKTEVPKQQPKQQLTAATTKSLVAPRKESPSLPSKQQSTDSPPLVEPSSSPQLPTKASPSQPMPTTNKETVNATTMPTVDQGGQGLQQSMEGSQVFETPPASTKTDVPRGVQQQPKQRSIGAATKSLVAPWNESPSLPSKQQSTDLSPPSSSFVEPPSSSSQKLPTKVAPSQPMPTTKKETTMPIVDQDQGLQQSMDLSQVFYASMQQMGKSSMASSAPRGGQEQQPIAATTTNALKKSPPSPSKQSADPPSNTSVEPPSSSSQPPTATGVDQRELWQQSMANDCLALDESPQAQTEAQTTTDVMAKDALSETNHALDVEDDNSEGDEETSQISDSYHDEGPDSVSLAEEKESAVRKSLLFTLLTCLGMVFLMKYIEKCCECCQKGEDDDDNQAAAHLLGDNNGGGNGNGNANANITTNNSLVQQMAVQASQKAAASTANGSQAMATAASGTAAGGAGITTALVVAGTLTLTAAAVGVVTLQNTTGGGWMCDATKEPTRHTGHVVLYLQGIHDASWVSLPSRRARLEEVFLQEYNRLAGCEETYQRFLENVALEENGVEELVMGAETIFRTNWTASVSCGGACAELEPLFYIRATDYDDPSLNNNAASIGEVATSGQEGGQGSRKLKHALRRLQQDTTEDYTVVQQEAWFLQAFVSNFSRALTTELGGANPPGTESSVIVFDGYTLSPLDGSLVERIRADDQGSPFNIVDATQDILETTGSSSSQRPPFDDLIPQCQATPSQREETGYLHVMVENLDCQILQEKALLSQLENLFRAIFNRVGKGCEGAFQRVMQSASLASCTSMKAIDAEMGTVFFADMDWTAFVRCDGCSSVEPVFLSSFRRLRGRQLFEDAAFLESFVSNLTIELETYYQNEDGALDTIYAASLDTSDMQTVVQFTGQRPTGASLVESPAANIFDQKPPDQGSSAGPNEGEDAGNNAEQNNPEFSDSGNGANIFDQNHSPGNATAIADQESQLCELGPGETMTKEQGRVNILIENVSPQLLNLDDAGTRAALEDAFRKSYNTVSGQCEGDPKRIVEEASLISYNFGSRGDGANYVETSWKTSLSCSGCNPKEPLFLGGNQLSSAARALQLDVSSMLGQFSSEFSLALDTTIRAASGISTEDWQPITIFYIETLSSDGAEVMQSTGYHPQFYSSSGAGASRPKPSGGNNNPTVEDEDIETCKKALVLEDSNSDNLLNQMEYVGFVHRLIDHQNASVDMHQIRMSLNSYDSLPFSLQEGFDTFSEGGEIPIYGDKQQDAPVEQQSFLFGFCVFALNETALLSKSEFSQDQSSTTDVAAPTPVPTTASSTSSSYVPSTSTSTTTASEDATLSPSESNPYEEDSDTYTSSPSAYGPNTSGSHDGTTPSAAVPTTTLSPSTALTLSPTTAPTTAAAAGPLGKPPTYAAFATVSPLSPVQKLEYTLKFYINYDGFVDREPTDVEYEGLRVSLEAFFFKLIEREYEASPETDLKSHDLTLREPTYIPNSTEDRYSHSLQFESDFAFTGVNPPVEDLYNIFDQMSLEELTAEAVFAAKPRHGIFFYTAGILWTNNVDSGSSSTRSATKSKDYTVKRSGVSLEPSQKFPLFRDRASASDP